MKAFQLNGCCVVTTKARYDVLRSNGYEFEVKVLQGPDNQYLFRAYGPNDFEFSMSENELWIEKRKLSRIDPISQDLKTGIFTALFLQYAFNEMVQLGHLRIPIESKG